MKSFEPGEVWEARAHHEASGSYVIGYFVNEWDAKLAAKGQGEWGSDGTIKKVRLSVTVYERYDEYEMARKNQVRQAALAKLTKEEREALGLTKEK